MNTALQEKIKNHNLVTKQPYYTVTDNKNNYEINISLPGVKKEDMDITLENQILQIQGIYKEEIQGMEPLYSKFTDEVLYRLSLQIGKSVDTDKIETSLVNGVLCLKLEKRVEFQKKTITIQ